MNSKLELQVEDIAELTADQVASVSGGAGDTARGDDTARTDTTRLADTTRSDTVRFTDTV